MSLRIVSGKFKGRVLQTPKGTKTRPTQESVREALFNICQGLIEGATVLDLFGGSGAIGFEALSRGASNVTFVEKDKAAITCIKKNIELLSVERETTLFPQDARLVMKKLGRFDLIYIDPPYDMNIEPIAREVLKNNLLKEKGTLFIEELFQKNKAPLRLEGLTLTSSRRFGKASLLEYRLS